MAWSSDTSIPIDHTKVADVPSAIRDVKLGLESGAITMASKVMVAPVISENIGIAVTSTAPTATTGVVKLTARTSAAATSSLYIMDGNGVEGRITDGAGLYAHTTFEMAKTAIMLGDLLFKNHISTTVGQIVVANTQSDTIVSILLNSADASDKGSVVIGAAGAATGTRAAAVALYGNENALPGQIVLQPGFVSTNATTRAAIVCKSAWLSEVLDPVSAQDAVTKTYFESKVGTGAFSPIPYAGEASVTFANGLVMKFGSKSCAGDATTALDFTTEGTSNFDNAILGVFLTANDSLAPASEGDLTVSNLAVTGFNINNGRTGTQTIYWLAIGY